MVRHHYGGGVINTIVKICFGVSLVAFSSCRPPANPAGSAQTSLEVTRLMAKREADHLLLKITTQFKNQGTEAVMMTAKSLTLLAGGESVPPLERPFPESVTVAPGQSGSGVFDFWLNGKHLASSLELKFGTDKVILKSAGNFSIEELPDGQLAILSVADWKILK